MVESAAQEVMSKVGFRSWNIHSSSEKDIFKINMEVDNKVFQGYSFYPEIEWGVYGYRPPEGYEIMGAWRHPKSKTFAFLIDNPKFKTVGSAINLLLYVTGDTSEILRLKDKIERLKTFVALEEEKVRGTTDAMEKLDRVHKSKSIAIITSIFGIFTAVINVLSIYLRRLPEPEFGNDLLIDIYGFILVLIHFSATLLFLIFIIICIAFLLKYSFILFRRL